MREPIAPLGQAVGHFGQLDRHFFQGGWHPDRTDRPFTTGRGLGAGARLLRCHCALQPPRDHVVGQRKDFWMFLDVDEIVVSLPVAEACWTGRQRRIIPSIK